MPLLKGYRLRRGPTIVLLALVGVVGSLLILATQLRPTLEVYAPVVVDQASAGTTYAVDDQVCVRGAQVGARVDRVEVRDGDGLRLRVALPPEGRAPVIAFPVDPDESRPVEDAAVPARGGLCLRLLLSSDRQGAFAAPRTTVRVRYGPAGVFRRSFDVTPPSTLEVTRTGRDPRLDAP